VFMKFKPTKSLDSIKEAITKHVTSLPDYLFIADMEGEWNMLVVMKVETRKNHPTSKIVEKFSEQVTDYRISKFDIKNVNLLHMSLLLL